MGRRHAMNETDPNADTRSRHAVILRGLLAALALCEVAALTGAASGVIAGGVAGLLRLPFFAPSMLGAFACQALLRPVRAELAAALALAAVLAWPLYTFVAADDFGWLMAASAALGAGTILVLAAKALTLRGSERDGVLDALLPAVILPCFVTLAYPMVYLTAALWPTTYDHRLYLADAAFGAPLSLVVGRATAAVPLLPKVCLAVYVGLPLALMLVHALRRQRGVNSSDALVAFVAVTVVGYFGYLAVPVAGPVFAFGDAFPLAPPDPATLGSAKSLVAPAPRNCMPSLHSAWALLVWWNARPLALAPRAAAAIFLAITLLATVGLGFHYVVDLVAAFPLTMAAQAWATRVSDARLRRLAIAGGLAATAGWMALVTWSGGIALWPAPACWLLAGTVVGASSWLERRVYAVRCEHEPESHADAVQAPSWTDRGAGLLLVLAGLAAFVHWAIVSNALALTFSSTAAVRLTLVAIGLLGVAAGAAVASRLPPTARPLRAAAFVAAALALACGLVPALLAPVHDGYVALAGAGSFAVVRVLLAVPVLLPATALTGAFAAIVAQHFACAGRAPAHAAALGLGLPLLGAAVGSLATAYALLPSLNSRGAPMMLMIVVAALAALLAWRGSAAEAPSAGIPRADEDGFAAAAWPFGAGMLAATGLLTGLFATTLLHQLTVVLGDTVYARAQMTFVLLLGLACGLLVARRPSAADAARLPFALAGAGASVIGGLLLWEHLPDYFGSFRGYVEQHKMTTNFGEREFVRLCVTGLMLLPSSFCLGAAAALSTGGSQRRPPADTLARTLTVGVPAGLLGVLVAALAIARLGSRFTLMTAAFLAVLAAAAVVFALLPRRRAIGVAALATAVVALLLVPAPDLSRLTGGSGLSFEPHSHGSVLDTAESIEGFVSVHEDERGNRRLVVDGQLLEEAVGPPVGRLAEPSAGQSAEPSARLAGLSPANRHLAEPSAGLAGLSHARGRDRALVIGAGDGSSARILREAKFAQVTVAEPNAAVGAMVGKYFGGIEGSRVVALDGRGVLVLDEPPFDLVVVEAVDFARPEAASLHTREFYALAAARLAPGGVLHQELALDHLSGVGITSVLASARRAFPQVWVSVRGEHAVVVACPGTCGVDRVKEASTAPRPGMEDPPRAAAQHEGERLLDPAAIDLLLESAASRLHVAVDALGSRDIDMFLPYHGPFSLLEPYDEPPASLGLLLQFAARMGSDPVSEKMGSDPIFNEKGADPVFAPGE